MIAVIACVQEDGGIGNRGELLYRDKQDLTRFKHITIGEHVVMGKKTWESLGGKPLPHRTNIVVSHSGNGIGESYPSESPVLHYNSFDKVYSLAKFEDVYVIGGASLYDEFTPTADWLFLTLVRGFKEADAFFDLKQLEHFNLISSDQSGEYEFRVYKRRSIYDR